MPRGSIDLFTDTAAILNERRKGGGGGEKKNTLSPRPLPAPFDSFHLLLSSESFNMALSRANCALKENACTAG